MTVNLVTGGSGFVGAHLVAALRRRGEQVRILDINEPAEPDPAADFIAASVTDPIAVAEAMQGVDAVFHTAANAHLWAKDKSTFDRVNRIGTRTVMAAAREARVRRVVHTSSLTVLVGRGARRQRAVVTETTSPARSEMAGPYCRSKYDAEREVSAAAASGLDVVSVLPTLPVGPGDHGLTAPTRMILDFVRRRTPAYLECLLNLIDVRDVAEGHVLARDKGTAGERYILGHSNMHLSELLERLQKISGVAMPTARVPYGLALAAAMFSEAAANAITGKPPAAPLTGVRLAGQKVAFESSKAIGELGLPQSDIDTALRDEIAWFVAKGLVAQAELPQFASTPALSRN